VDYPPTPIVHSYTRVRRANYQGRQSTHQRRTPARGARAKRTMTRQAKQKAKKLARGEAVATASSRGAWWCDFRGVSVETRLECVGAQ
jgi:hypothetical protein